MNRDLYKIKNIIRGLLSRDLVLEFNYRRDVKHN